MRKILFVTASLMGEASQSRRIAAEFIAAARDEDGAGHVAQRHLTPANTPHLSMDTLGALGAAPESRSPAQAEAVGFADGLIAEVEAADTIVIATPMYNFSIPSTLKAWLDHIARAGRTFRYTAAGPEGLLTGKKVIVVVSRGGFYAGEAPGRVFDFQEPYLKAFFGFLGITDVRFVHVEGQAIGADVAAQGLAAARQELADLARVA